MAKHITWYLILRFSCAFRNIKYRTTVPFTKLVGLFNSGGIQPSSIDLVRFICKSPYPSRVEWASCFLVTSDHGHVSLYRSDAVASILAIEAKLSSTSSHVCFHVSGKGGGGGGGGAAVTHKWIWLWCSAQPCLVLILYLEEDIYVILSYICGDISVATGYNACVCFTTMSLAITEAAVSYKTVSSVPYHFLELHVICKFGVLKLIRDITIRPL